MFNCFSSSRLSNLSTNNFNFACFGTRHSPYLCRVPDIVPVETIFYVFGCDAVSGRFSNLSPSRQRADALCVTLLSRTKKHFPVLVYNSNIFRFHVMWKQVLCQHRSEINSRLMANILLSQVLTLFRLTNKVIVKH